MLTNQQISDDAKSLLNDLVLELKVRSVARKDQEEVLLDAAKVLAVASKALVSMIADKYQMTMH